MRKDLRLWTMSDETSGTASEISRDPRNIYRVTRSTIYKRLSQGMRDPEDVFAPSRSNIVAKPIKTMRGWGSVAITPGERT